MARVCEPHSPSILSRDVGSVDSTRLLRSARAVVSLRKAPFASISCRVRLEWHAQLIATFLRSVVRGVFSDVQPRYLKRNNKDFRVFASF